MQAASAGNARVDDVPGAQGANAEETLDSGHQPGYAAASVTLGLIGPGSRSPRERLAQSPPIV
jgi:hypothetical protein